MQAERWKRVEQLYEAARAVPLEKRGEFLKQACQDDAELREEVQSLLNQQTDGFLESAPVPAVKTLSAGVKLGNFEIVELLGRGGMGEVYRARDSRLKRDVAIKVLPAALAHDPDRIARFEREARAASALNHPNIVAIHDIGHEGGKYWIVSELVDGESLRALIARGPLPAAKASAIAAQIASGLAAAHAAGLVHRDLKPDNIMVTRDGHVKILDFGLAKQRRTAPDSTSTDLTDEGVVLGTAGYMSPEQVRGEPADHRSDLFSFGVVLHEMLSGKRVFVGSSSVEVMNAILKQEPPELPAPVPPALARVVQRCLEKEPDRRFQSAADLGFSLRALSLSPAPTERPKRRAWWKWAALLAAASAALAALYWLTRSLPPPRVIGMVQITRDNIPRTHDLPLLSDGSRVFFLSYQDYYESYEVSAAGGESVKLPLQTKGAAYLMDTAPKLNDYLTCRSSAPRYCELWAEPVLGGSPRRLGSLMSWKDGAAWSPDGAELVYTRDDEVRLAHRDGTEIRKLANVTGRPCLPRWSPDGGRIRFCVEGASGKPTRIWEVLTDGTGLRPVLPDWYPSRSMECGNWTPDGKYFVFEADQKIWAVREKTGLLRRSPRQPIELNTGLLSASQPLPSTDGKRLFFDGSHAENEFLRYDLRTGAFALELPGISGSDLEFSQDGKWVTYVSVPEGILFRSAADGSQRLQITSPPMGASSPHWSPDGKQIAFTGGSGGPARIYVVPFEGGVARQVSSGESGPHGDWDPSWSSDGTLLAFGATVYDEGSKESVHVVDLRTNRVSTLPGSRGMWSPRWSPDGHFIAGLTGLGWKLVLLDLRTQKQTVLFSNGSGYPTWSRDGEFLFFRSAGWWRIHLRDRKAELLNDLKGFPLAGGWFTVAPNNSLITARNTGTDQIYALDWELP